MASTINGTSTGNGGLISTGDDSGILNIQTNETTAITVDASQKATFVNDASINGVTVGKGNGAVATNIAVGASALAVNTSGSNNLACGVNALDSNTTGTDNIAIGNSAGQAVVTASGNVFIGSNAGAFTTGAENTFIGSGVTGVDGGAGFYVTTGAKNTILGKYDGNQGGLDIRTASNYIVLSDGDGNPRFYHNGTYWTIPSGPLLVPYIYATTGAGAGTVVVGTDGNLFRSSSSARYKKDIVDARYGLSDLLKLRAVNYKGSGEQDTDKLLGGLIAEEVDEAGLQEFVIYDDQKRPDALHYAQMVSLCVKSIQELKTIVDAQAETINALTARIVALETA
jgi:hypothetical protein